MRYSKLATDYALSCGKPMTGFTTVLNGTFLLLIPLGMLLCSGGGWPVLVDLIFYIPVSYTHLPEEVCKVTLTF